MVIALSLALALAPPLSVEAAAARYGPALATLHYGEAQQSVAFFVSSAGMAATALPADVAAVVVEGAGGERRPGRVVARDADGVALVQIERTAADAAPLPALAVAAEDRVFAPQVWLLGLGVVEGRVEPALGGLRRVDDRGRWRLDLPLERGAPVVHDGQVVAVVVARDGRTASVAVAAGRLRALAGQVGRPPAPPR